ncbi:hypothetical protein BXY75_0976 [Ulvibacter antarcticus]|uniref:Uncharacterized protein n=2 Tax=Ulvibacter antarcticus TaxID=442714 RepID=A0A3L9Z502_9FLAO|nr:hypothetical protein BXY75_0976 [Ulvibacter antarcticus]
MRQQRICIHSSDIQAITGKGARSARKILQTIREKLGKERHQPISYCELAGYLGLNPEVVFKTINGIPVVISD